MKKLFIVFAILMSVATNAQDRFFAYTYTSNVLPKGNIDLELWHTSRFGHEDQYFHGMDQRMELEVGLGSRWQTAFYFNRYQKSFSVGDDIVQSNEIGFSNEWKWQVKPAVGTKPGIALYGELGLKGDEIELETKLIMDKSFGKNLVAFNFVYEIEEEVERENGETEFEVEGTPVELDLAYMRNINPSFGIGLEVVDHNDIAKGHWMNSVLYAGPTLNFRGNRWFGLVNYLPQLSNIHKTDFFPKSKVLDEHEKGQARVLVGFSF